MNENNDSSYNNSPIKEIENSRKLLDSTKKSYIDGSLFSKNISKG